MVKNGTGKTRQNHKDYGYHENRQKLRGITPPHFPAFYNADRLNWRPNQGIAETLPIAHTAQPTGCTNFSTAYCANNLDGAFKYLPDTLESLTHANAQGGADIRDQLNTVLPPDILHPNRLNWFPAYYNIRPMNGLDWFDALRLALMEGIAEHRIITVGSPWFGSFESVDGNGILTMPFSLNLNGVPWHNHLFIGEITINNQPYLMCESHQGAGYGDKGLVYWSRELVNSIMSISGSAAFIPASAINNPSKISLEWWEKILSIIRQFGKSWLPFSYGSTATLWDTPSHIRRNVRVMCDNAGLSWKMKVNVCAIIHQESNWNPKAVNTHNMNGTSDYGLVQINSHAGYWIGQGLYFTSTGEVLNFPEKSAQFIVMQAKANNLKLWSSYNSGAYLKYLAIESLPSVSY